MSISGAVAEAASVGEAINSTRTKITTDIEEHNIDLASHPDIRAMVTGAKHHILFKDIATGEEYKVYVENGILVCDSNVVKPTSIAITTKPTKTSYGVGDLFDPSGMVVTATYSDGTTKAVTTYTYPTSTLTTGTTSITISYTEGSTFTTTVNITVIAGFNPAATLQDFNYVDNGNGTYTITGWKGTKNGVVSTEVEVPDNSVIIVNPSDV